MANALANNEQKIPEELKVVQGGGPPISPGASCSTQPRITFNATLEAASA
jgi:hypothetical protein